MNSTSILKDLGQALRRFGEYSFDDKGPSEVMDIESLVTQLRNLPAAKAGKILNEVASSNKYKGRGLSVAAQCVIDMQDWDDLFAVPGIDNIYTGVGEIGI